MRIHPPEAYRLMSDNIKLLLVIVSVTVVLILLALAFAYVSNDSN